MSCHRPGSAEYTVNAVFYTSFNERKSADCRYQHCKRYGLAVSFIIPCSGVFSSPMLITTCRSGRMQKGEWRSNLYKYIA
jgi:hypothetical protein